MAIFHDVRLLKIDVALGASPSLNKISFNCKY